MRSFACALLLCGCSYDWTYRPDAGSATTQKDAAAGDPNANEDAGTPCFRDKSACPPGQYCRFVDRSCGLATVSGECAPAGTACKDEPQCVCDGTIAGGCEAQKRGLDVDESSATCKGPGGETFACGDTKCMVKQEYCQSKSGGASFGCLPTTCVDCKCLAIDPSSGCVCDESTPGQLRVDCK